MRARNATCPLCAVFERKARFVEAVGTVTEGAGATG